MSELKGRLLELGPTSEAPRSLERFSAAAGTIAFKGDLAPDTAVKMDEPRFSITNRDSGTTYTLIGQVKKSGGQATLRFEAADGSGSRVTLPASRLQEALSTPGGAWRGVSESVAKS